MKDVRPHLAMKATFRYRKKLSNLRIVFEVMQSRLQYIFKNQSGSHPNVNLLE